MSYVFLSFTNMKCNRYTDKMETCTCMYQNSACTCWLKVQRVQNRDGISDNPYIGYFVNIGYRLKSYRLKYRNRYIGYRLEQEYRISATNNRYAIPSTKFIPQDQMAPYFLFILTRKMCRSMDLG